MSIRKIVPVDQAEWGVGPSPSWVENREPDWHFAPAEIHPLAILLIDEQHHVASQSISCRNVRRLLTHAAVQALGQVEVEFDPAAYKLVIHELAVWRLGTDGRWTKRSLAQREAFLLRQREQQLEQQMLNGRLSVVALLEDVRKGDAIDLSWTLEPRERLDGLRFTAFHAFCWTVPVARAFFTLHLDVAQPIQFRLHAPKGATKPEETIEPTRAVYSVNDPPVFAPEPNAPGWSWPWPVLDVSGWANWTDVAGFFADLWADALADGAGAVAAEVSLLRTQAAAGDDAVRAAVRFVQEDVRYLAADFGHGAGMLPNGAGTVLRRRFGDCKDKSVLLSALLRALGCDAGPLLVSDCWRDAVARLQPSTAAFNHVIVTFVVDGVRHFVDPTCIGQGGGLQRLVPASYGCGLEVRHGAEGLLALPPRPRAELSINETFQLDIKQRDGSVEQVLRATSWMADDLRAFLLRQGRGAFFKNRAEQLQKIFPALVPCQEAGEIADDVSGNVLELKARHALPTWGQPEEKPPTMFSYGAHGLSLAVEPVEGPERRIQPWSLRHPLRVHHCVLVRGRCVHKVKPEHHRFTGPGFVYTCDVTPRRHAVMFDYCWETTQSEIAPEQWQEYCRERSRAFQRSGANVPTWRFWSAGNWRVATIGIAVVAFVGIGIVSDLVKPVSPGSSVEGRQQVERGMRLALDAFQRGDFATAQPLLEKVEPHYGGSFEYFTMAAEAALHTGHLDRARQSLASARRVDPSNLINDLLDALLHEKEGDLMTAREALDHVLARAPADTRALFALGRVNEQLGDTTGARRALERFLGQQPAHPDALTQYSLLLWSGGERERADAAMLGAVRAQPAPSALLETALSRYYAATGRPTEAVAPALRAVGLAPTDPLMAANYARALARTGDAHGALESAQEAAGRFPKHPAVLAALATAAAAMGDNDIAMQAFQTRLKVAPLDPAAHSDFGYFLHRTGRTAEARAVLEKALRDFPGSGLLWLNYSVVLETLGDTAAARDARNKAKRLLPVGERAALLR